MGLPVYRIFDPIIRAECDPSAWEAQISMMEMVLEPDALAEAVKGMRDKYSQNSIE